MRVTLDSQLVCDSKYGLRVVPHKAVAEVSE